MPLPEKSLIHQIRRLTDTLPHRQAKLRKGIGDDCAVLRVPCANEILVTTDFSLEGIHFRRDWHPADAVGHRCLTRGLSDIAAMGGEPTAAFLSLALPADLPQSWVTGFMRGLLRLACRHHVTLAGGDTAQSPNGILTDIIVVGTVPRDRAILRSGARAGDFVYVSGELGGSAAAVAELEAHPRQKLSPREYPRHFYPEARLELAGVLRKRHLVSAMIDTSDGLSTDLAHICEESRVGAILDETSIPRAQAGKHGRVVDLSLALNGGEDYELLFTARPEIRIPAAIAGIPITCIGQITSRRKLVIDDGTGALRKLPAHGWEHFQRARKIGRRATS